MADPYVRKVEESVDADGVRWAVGVDYDLVCVGGYRLTRAQCEEFARAFVAACWEAADNSRLMREEAAG